MNDAALQRLSGSITAYLEAKTRTVTSPSTDAAALGKELQQLFSAATSPYADLREAAAYCRVSPATIRVAAAAGHIETLRPTGCSAVRFRKTDLDRWLAGRAKPGPKGNQ